MPEPGPSRTVARLIADALYAAGVRHAFTVPGESFLGLLDVLGEAGIRVVAARHEGGAGFMAGAYGHLTGRPAALLVTRAVGAGNASIAIHTAYADSAPLFVLVGQVPLAFRGREAFQEVDQVTTFGGLAKWAAEPRDPEAVVEAVQAAVRQALGGRPGPVLLALAEDLLDQPAPAGATVDLTLPAPAPPATDAVRAVVELLATAERPAILAGAGVLRAGASAELARFAELLDVPVIASWRRGDVLDNEHPLYLGMTGYWAPSTVLPRLEAADALLVLGSRLSDPTTFGYRIPRAGQRWAHFDLDPTRPSSSLEPAELAIAADAGAFLRAAIDRVERDGGLDPWHLEARRANNAADRQAWEAATVIDRVEWEGLGVHPGRIVATLQRVLPQDAILTTDAGNFAGWAARGFRFRQPGTMLGPTSGAMGYAVPAAVAAAVAHPDRTVVAMAGDGGLGMTMAELETGVREGLRFVVLCFDNQRYGTIRMWQERRGRGQGVATELGPIDFAGVARALGAGGIRVESEDEFEPVLREALASDRPVVIHLVLDRRWVSVNTTPESAGAAWT
ncbi:MAG: acetolactate synthase large subunit [Chloroflexota bacterium]|jgi:acetolactate synthase-1/2/3 large subunit|nr:acetolactate synthase large subunit [Chloroflexota bacterium]